MLEDVNLTQKDDSMINIKVSGSFTTTERFLKRASELDIRNILDKYGQRGVQELRHATPVDSGKTRDLWGYEIEVRKGYQAIYWTNSSENQGVPIAIILQYGHGTGNGGYVKGVDYINPAMKNIFEGIAREAWEEVTNG